MGLTAESLQVENKSMKNVQVLDTQKLSHIIDTATQLHSYTATQLHSYTATQLHSYTLA